MCEGAGKVRGHLLRLKAVLEVNVSDGALTQRPVDPGSRNATGGVIDGGLNVYVLAGCLLIAGGE